MWKQCLVGLRLLLNGSGFGFNGEEDFFFMELKPFEENIWPNVLFVAMRVILETIDA